MNLVKMQLSEIHMYEARPEHVVVLNEENGDRALPIVIGFFEAQALDFSVQGNSFQRPLTHDLIYNILDSLKISIEKIVIDKLENNTFFGKLVLKEQDNDEEYWVDTRPSDALVLASKRNIPIFVEEEVLIKTSEENE